MKLPSRKTLFRVARVSAIIYVLYHAYPEAFAQLGHGVQQILMGCFSSMFSLLWKAFKNSIISLGGGVWDGLCKLFSWLKVWEG